MGNLLDKQKNIAIKKEGIDEMNICDFPISVLSKDKRDEPLIFKDTITDPVTKEEVMRTWQVEGRQLAGLPTIYEEIVGLLVLQYAKEQNCNETRSPVTYSTHKLLSDLGWISTGLGGAAYEFHDMALFRLSGLRITCTNSFYDNNLKRRLGVVTDFGLIQEFSIYGKHAQKHEILKAYCHAMPFNAVKLTDRILNHLNVYTIDTDFAILCGLKRPLSKRAYRYLNKNFHSAKIDGDRLKLSRTLKPLCYEHFGMSRSYNLGQLKRELDKICEELLKSSVILDSKYEGEQILFYRKFIDDIKHQGTEIVKYWMDKVRKEIWDIPLREPTEKEIQYTASLIRELGYDVVKHIANYSVSRAIITGFKMQNFAAVEQYKADALRDIEAKQSKAANELLKKKASLEEKKQLEENEKRKASLLKEIENLSPEEKVKLEAEAEEISKSLHGAYWNKPLSIETSQIEAMKQRIQKKKSEKCSTTVEQIH